MVEGSGSSVRSSVKFVLDYVLSHASGDERPYVSVSIFGKNLLSLLDSGTSKTIIGSKGWKILEGIGLVDLMPSDIPSVTVANGDDCKCLGILRAPIKLREAEKIIDILVVPDLNHTLILGIDFWMRMGIIPDLRSNEWKFGMVDAVDTPATGEALHHLDSLSSEQTKVLNDLVARTFVKMGDGIGCTTIVEHNIEIIKDV